MKPWRVHKRSARFAANGPLPASDRGTGTLPTTKTSLVANCAMSLLLNCARVDCLSISLGTVVHVESRATPKQLRHSQDTPPCRSLYAYLAELLTANARGDPLPALA